MLAVLLSVRLLLTNEGTTGVPVYRRTASRDRSQVIYTFLISKVGETDLVNALGGVGCMVSFGPSDSSVGKMSQ